MTKRMKKDLTNIIFSGILFFLAILVEKIMPGINENLLLILFLLAYFVIGRGVVKEAAINIIHGQVFDENFLMAIATIGAFLIGEYPEAVAVMLFYQVGELDRKSVV